MATEIESYVRAIAQVDPAGNWHGMGVNRVSRLGAGLYLIEVEDAFESRVSTIPSFQGEIDGVIHCANADATGTALLFTYRMNTETEIVVAFYDSDLAPADPSLFTFSVRVGNTETPLVPVL